jgi:hypothetical protein
MLNAKMTHKLLFEDTYSLDKKDIIQFPRSQMEQSLKPVLILS